MTVLLAIVLAAFHLENDHLVTFDKRSVYLHNNFCSLDNGCADFYGTVIVYEQYFVKLYGLTCFSVLNVVHEEFLSLFYLELLAVNAYDCVHFNNSNAYVHLEAGLFVRLLSLSLGDKIGCEITHLFCNGEIFLRLFYSGRAEKRKLELQIEFYVQQSSCKEVGDGVHVVAHIGNPVVGIDIIDA